jgi:2-amino-4-hydroxy-6-hydroxymethyldihydropteridine diphosphokinase
MSALKRTFIALGANVPSRTGTPTQTLKAAAEKIAALPGVHAARMSSIYHSEPAFVEEQPVFCNAAMCVELDTSLIAPQQLLGRMLAIEASFGRMRDAAHIANGPRPLDLDLLDVEGVVCDEPAGVPASEKPQLILPHPGILERDFVVTPLLELEPYLVLANGVVVTREYIRYGKVL